MPSEIATGTSASNRGTTGPPTSGTVSIVSVDDEGTTESSSIDELALLLRSEPSTIWVDLTAPGAVQVDAVAEALGVHALIVEDIVEPEARAKLEAFDDVLHIVLFALTRDGTTRLDEVDFVLGRRFLVTVHPVDWDPHAARQLRAGLALLMRRGPDALLWALCDALVDDYFPVFDQLADEIEAFEDRVLDRADHETLTQVLEMKRELIRIRHAVAPGREVFSQLTSHEYDLIREPQVFYFRDVYDHLVRLTEEFDSFRELTGTTIELYLSTVNNNLAAIMKRLTGVTVVLAGIAAVAGLFGMSEAGPLLDGREGGGFWLITLVTIVGAAVVLAVLRRIGWV